MTDYERFLAELPAVGLFPDLDLDSTLADGTEVWKGWITDWNDADVMVLIRKRPDGTFTISDWEKCLDGATVEETVSNVLGEAMIRKMSR